MILRLDRCEALSALNLRARQEALSTPCRVCWLSEAPSVAKRVFRITRDELLYPASANDEFLDQDALNLRFKSEWTSDERDRVRFFMSLGIDPCDDHGLMPIMRYFGVPVEALCRGMTPPASWAPLEKLRQQRQLRRPSEANDNLISANDDEPRYDRTFVID